MLQNLKVGDVVGYVEIAKEAPTVPWQELRWHVVITEPSREKTTLDRLGDITGLEIKPYLPLVHSKVSAGRGRKRAIERAMFPSYLFVPIPATPEWWRQVRATRGVQDFLTFTSGRPKILADELVERIRKAERQIDAKRQMSLAAAGMSEFKIGQMVWAEVLPLRRVLASIIAFDSRGRAEVQLDEPIFGREMWPVEPLHLHEID